MIVTFLLLTLIGFIAGICKYMEQDELLKKADSPVQNEEQYKELISKINSNNYFLLICMIMSYLIFATYVFVPAFSIIMLVGWLGFVVLKFYIPVIFTK